jgi:phosphohistidine phosphatase
MGRWLGPAGCVPDQVLCSTARRARETWQLAEAELAAIPPVSSEGRVYQASAAGLLDLIRQAASEVRTLLVIGHDPAVQELALLLAGTAPDERDGSRGSRPVQSGALDRMRAKFPTAALAVLEFTGTWPQLAPGRARLAGFLTPRDIPR